MSRIFNFYIDSLHSDSGTNNNSNYFRNWRSVLPHGKYKCTFTYTSVFSNNGTGTNNADISPAFLHINLGCNSNFIYSSNKLSNTDTIGFLKWGTFGPDNTGKGFLYSDITTNPPFYFNNGLLNNFINVKITEYDGTTLWVDGNHVAPGDYILCLSFELME